MLWHDTRRFPDWLAFPLATLDTPYVPSKQKHVYVDSKARWYEISDHWPKKSWLRKYIFFLLRGRFYEINQWGFRDSFR
jgi:hypothetical protein